MKENVIDWIVGLVVGFGIVFVTNFNYYALLLSGITYIFFLFCEPISWLINYILEKIQTNKSKDIV